MARITSALLCDFAQVREGLLFVCSAGLTRIHPPELPAPLGIMVAVMVEVAPDEFDVVHELTVTIKAAETAEHVARFVGGFQVGHSDAEPGEPVLVPFTPDFRQMSVAKLGAYDVWLSVDGGTGEQLTFYVKPPLPRAL